MVVAENAVMAMGVMAVFVLMGVALYLLMGVVVISMLTFGLWRSDIFRRDVLTNRNLQQALAKAVLVWPHALHMSLSTWWFMTGNRLRMKRLLRRFWNN